MRRTLLILNIFMGVLILVGSVALVVGLVNKAGDVAPSVDLTRTIRVGLGLPKGATVESVTTTRERIVLLVKLPDGGQVVWVVPAAGGAPLRIDPTAKPEPSRESAPR